MRRSKAGVLLPLSFAMTVSICYERKSADVIGDNSIISITMIRIHKNRVLIPNIPSCRYPGRDASI
jgi:hypothetical protein